MSIPQNTNLLFLLGGYDLEMLEIKNMLERAHVKYIDKKLSWGAKLSSYQEYFNRPEILAGIELIEDITTPRNYISIDHHNEFSNLPPSIVQVAKLLDVQLNRWQQLIAANDVGYIPAMIKIGASEKEIADIRKADREAQGVSEEDERLAEESIKNRQTKIDVVLIRALTDKFSPITDRMFGKADKLLVYNSNKLNYYGPGKDKLVSLFHELVKEQKAYHGGGKAGFFGIAANAISKDEIEMLIPAIVNEISK